MSSARRVFEHHQIWRLTPDALHEATTLLFVFTYHAVSG
jgi:hypothetical protein